MSGQGLPEMPEIPDQLYKISTVAKMLDLKTLTVRKYIKAHNIKVIDTLAGQRISRAELSKLVTILYKGEVSE